MGTNRKGQGCTRCGTYLAPGQGNLWRCGGEETGCPISGHFDEGGWHVTCPDKGACDIRRTTAIEDAKKRREARDMMEAEIRAIDPAKVENCTTGSIPSDAVSLVKLCGDCRGLIWKGIAGQRDIYVTPTAVYAYTSSYDDMPRIWKSTDPEIVRRAQEFVSKRQASSDLQSK